MGDNPAIKPQVQTEADPVTAKFQATPQPLAVTYTRREMPVYYVAGHELEGLTHSGDSIYLAVSSAAFGAFITIVSVLKTTPLGDPSTHAVFVWGSIVTGLLTVVYGFMCFRAQRIARRKLADITGRPQG